VFNPFKSYIIFYFPVHFVVQILGQCLATGYAFSHKIPKVVKRSGWQTYFDHGSEIYGEFGEKAVPFSWFRFG
jgi:hypothetical protein